jgi:cytidylate kinase
MKSRVLIAIDGPAGSGKSTVARRVAKILGILYLDTGAMYRAVTLKAIQDNIPFDDQERLTVLANQVDLKFTQMPDGTYHLFMNGENINEEIRSFAVTNNVSVVSSVPGVREALVQRQREIGAKSGVVMDGRDIGTVVLPNADLKIFLTASLEKRAQRRWLELKAKGIKVSKEKIKEDLKERDDFDSNREISPLRPASDSIIIDTTGISIEQVTEKIVNLSKQKLELS